MVSNAFTQGNMKGAVLTVTQVQDIRALYRDGITQGELCRRFDVSIVTIGRIVRRETWRKIPDLATSMQALDRAAAASEAKFKLMQEQEKAPNSVKVEREALRELDEGPINPLEEE